MLKHILLIAGLAAAGPAAVNAGTFAFNFPVDLSQIGRGGDAVAVADFNGDGRDDLVAIVQGHLEIILQGGEGQWSPVQRFDSPALGFLALKGSDLDRDGTSEILAGYSGGLVLYEWNGAGFSVTHHSARHACAAMATGDLDLDGRQDVFCLGRMSEGALYYSTSAGGLQAPSYMAIPMYNSSRMQAQLEDVTGDGRPDLLLAGLSANSFYVMPHDGEQGFLPAVAYPYPEDDNFWPAAIQAADLDGDGAKEVIVAKPCNRPCSALLVYKRGAHGYLQLSDRIPTHDLPFAILAADIDRNGSLDLLIGHGGWSAVGRYMGWGRATSSSELLSMVTSDTNPNGYALGDLNNDGITDLAVANTFGISLLYGGQRAAQDFDGDLKSDLFWRHSNGQNMVWSSVGDDGADPLESLDPLWSVQATGDFDGNGLAELALRHGSTGANLLWELGYDRRAITAVTSRHWQIVGAGDFDGDQRDDLLWRNSSTGANTIWKSGNSATKQATSTVSDLRWQVVGVGDFDGDGRSDILWRHSASGRNAIWRAGRSAGHQELKGVGNLAWKVAGVGDFNGDGRDDVMWRNSSTGANTIWLSANGATQQAVRGVSNLAWTIAAVADYNGDGRSDLLWRNLATGDNVIWRQADSRQQQPLAPLRDLGWKLVP